MGTWKVEEMEYNIRIDIMVVGCDGERWLELAQCFIPFGNFWLCITDVETSKCATRGSDM